MRPYILSETNWKDIQKNPIELVILPWGACEAHNFHMPYGTDIYEADFIAAESAKKAYEKGAKIMVLPTIPYGVNTGQTDILLDMNIYPSTQHAILSDLIEVVHRQGIRKFLIMNSHGGNNFKTILRELGVEYKDMFLSQCDWFRSLDKSKYFEEGGDHADEMETSLILHFLPHLVKNLDEAGDGTDRKIKVRGIREGWAWAEREWSQVTKDTGVGNPKKATAEKGQRFFEDVTDKLAELYLDICKLDLADKYE
jgi:creatinine amidohydrolase